MRNLKKFLALVLAMMMAFSLMLTANAANPVREYPDAGSMDPAFEEAVDVLTGMGVYSGDNGNLKPAATITRAEVAALIYRLATGDVTDAQAGLYARYGNFPDVKEDAWYAGYVGYCANAGYIKGRSDGTFDPSGAVTGYEVLAMILRAIGYDKNGEFTGATWQTEVSALSQQLGVLDNVKTTQYGGTLYLAARRDVVADLLFQADAKVRMVNYTPAFGYQPYGDVVTSGTWNNLAGGVPNNTLGYKIFGLYEITDGVVVGNVETGEKSTKMGYAGSTSKAWNPYGSVAGFEILPISWDAFTYEGDYEVTVTPTAANAIQGDAMVSLGSNYLFDIETGIDKVGHQMDYWVNVNNYGSKGYQVYAYIDNVVLAEVVKVDASTSGNPYALNATASVATETNLYDAMKAAGFSVSSSTRAHLNNSYGRFSLDKKSSVAGDLYTYDSDGDDLGDIDVAAQTSPEYLYMVVSNSASKAPDAVIALNLQASQVTGVDNVNTIKTVTVPFTVADNTPAAGHSGVTDGNSGWPFIAGDNVLTAAANAGSVVKGGTLEQKQLVGDSAKTLGQKEIGLHITGTTKNSLANGTAQSYTPERTGTNAITSGSAYDRSYFKLSPVTNTKDGVVIAYNNTSVTLQDGTVLEKSIVYDTVVDDTIPQAEVDGAGNDLYEHTNYRFYLTEGGKYVGAERLHGTTFIYGTYMDYEQAVNTSTFKYYMTGVTLDGETTTVPVTHLALSNNATPSLINSTDSLGIPFRDTSYTGQYVNGIGTGVYRGFAYGDDVANWTFAGLNDIGVIAGANGSSNDSSSKPTVVDDSNGLAGPASVATLPTVAFDGIESTSTETNGDKTTPANTASDSIIIGSTEVALGATYAGTVDLDGSGAGAADLLYFTENTKFILVSGYGTDSLKPQVFNGISELKGTSSEVQINLQYTVNNTVSPTVGDQTAGTVQITSVDAGVTMADMTYFTQSPFLYAQNQVLSRQADVIILPAAAVTRTESSSLRYVGNATPTMANSNAVLGVPATQFTMYNNGVAESVWVQGLVNSNTSDNVLSKGSESPSTANLSADAVADTGHDHFYKLIDTGLTANDGKPIYTVELANLQWTQNKYVASTYSAQTGSFTWNATITGKSPAETSMMNVGSANITNLNAQNPTPTWPGITNLQTLNEAGSLSIYTNLTSQYGGNTTLYVSAIADSSTSVTQIYVCYDQTPQTP